MIGYWIVFFFSTDDCLYVKCEFGYPERYAIQGDGFAYIRQDLVMAQPKGSSVRSAAQGDVAFERCIFLALH